MTWPPWLDTTRPEHEREAEAKTWLKSTPSDSEIDAVSRAWLAYQDGKDERYWWACELLFDGLFLAEPGTEYTTPATQDVLWRTILGLCAAVDPNDPDGIGMIGASPLENFIEILGDAAMDRIEPELATNPVLLMARAGVWDWDNPVRPRVDRCLAAYGQERQ